MTCSIRTFDRSSALRLSRACRRNNPSFTLRVSVKLDVPTFAPFERMKGTLRSGQHTKAVGKSSDFFGGGGDYRKSKWGIVTLLLSTWCHVAGFYMASACDVPHGVKQYDRAREKCRRGDHLVGNWVSFVQGRRL